MHRMGAKGLLGNPHEKVSESLTFGRPVRKASRKGKPLGLNKTGHRNHKGK